MNDLPQLLLAISYQALPLLFAMVLHEYAHGWVADRCGDSTAKTRGRLTLDPLAHIDPFGTIIVPLLCLMLPGSFLLGWAKPVPIDTVHYSPGFVPYGTPFGEDVDPSRARLAELEREIEELRKEVAVLKAARQPQPKVKSA